MIVATEAVVLKSMKYRETSKILTLYTREYGKMSVLAKGAREARNRFGAALNHLSHVQAVIYKKENRDLQLLSQCDVISPMRRLTDDIERMAPAMAAVELTDLVTPPEELNLRLYDLLVETLQAIDRATKNPANPLYLFEVRLLDLMGFRPNFHRCYNCGTVIDEETIGGRDVRVSYGGILCPVCSEKGMGLEPVGPGTARMLQRLQEFTEVDAVTRVTMTPHMRNEVATALRRYLQTHVEGLRSLRSESVFGSLLP